MAGGFWPCELGPRGYLCAHGRLWSLGGFTDLGRTLICRGPQLRQLMWLYSPPYSSSKPWACSQEKAGEREGGKEGGGSSPLLHPIVQTKSQTNQPCFRERWEELPTDSVNRSKYTGRWEIGGAIFQKFCRVCMFVFICLLSQHPVFFWGAPLSLRLVLVRLSIM